MSQKKRLISKAQFAKKYGITPSAVTQNNSLKAALDGGKIDLNHEAAMLYESEYQKKQNKDQTPQSHVEDYIQDYAQWTIQKVIDEFGTEHQFKAWLDARKSIADLTLKDIESKRRKNEVISREFVQTYIFTAFETFNIRLLNDASRTLSRKLFSICKSGGTLEKAHEVSKKTISHLIQATKREIETAMKNASN